MGWLDASEYLFLEVAARERIADDGGSEGEVSERAPETIGEAGGACPERAVAGCRLRRHWSALRAPGA